MSRASWPIYGISAKIEDPEEIIRVCTVCFHMISYHFDRIWPKHPCILKQHSLTHDHPRLRHPRYHPKLISNEIGWTYGYVYQSIQRSFNIETIATVLSKIASNDCAGRSAQVRRIICAIVGGI